MPESHVSNADPKIFVDGNSIECPSIIFVMLEDSSKDSNNTAK